MALAQNPVIYLTRKMWKYSEGNRKRVALYFFLFTIANLINLLEPLVMAAFFNVVQQQGITAASVPSLTIYLVLFFLLTPGFWIFHGPSRSMERHNAFLVRAHYKKYLLDGVLAYPPEWHTDHHSGDTISRIEKGTHALYNYTEDTFEVIESAVRLVGSFVALAYFSLWAGGIMAVMTALTFVLIVQFDKRLVAQYKELNIADNKVSQSVFDILSNIITVIILRVERVVSSALYEKVFQPLQLFTRNSKINEVKWFLVSMMGTLMGVLVLGVFLYGGLLAGAPLLVGTLFALYGYIGRINDIFFRFAYKYSDIVEQKAAVMNAEEIANDFSSARLAQHSRLKNDWHELSIDGLTFSYHTAPATPDLAQRDKGATAHLNNVSLHMKKGERIALIGESGSGKTTLLRVMRELYHPQKVTVMLDGVVLPQAFGAISDDIALIPQDPEIFSTTIGENITFGVDHSLDTVKKFTDMAAFTSVIERLPHKLDSYIHEKGVNLSGGEKQRLALARGLLASSDKAIVLLDEPTSSVDTKNELQIFQNIFGEFQDKTIVASVHRLHLLPLFDAIYFFKRGKVIARGTLEELLQTSPEFKRLWEKYHKPSKRRP